MSDQPFLTRAMLDARAGDLPTEKVDIPGWGTAIVRGLSAAERDAYEADVVIMRRTRSGRMEEGRDYHNIRAKLVVRCLVDPDGNLLYKPNEYDVLGTLPAAVVDPLWEAATRLSGMTDEDVQELVEDFGETPTSSSGSPSPSPSAAPSPSLAGESGAGN